MDENKKESAFVPAIIMFVCMMLYYLYYMVVVLATDFFDYGSFDILSLITNWRNTLGFIASVTLMIITLVRRKQSAIGITSFLFLSVLSCSHSIIFFLTSYFDDIKLGYGVSFGEYLSMNMSNIVGVCSMIVLSIAAIVLLIVYWSKHERKFGLASMILVALIILRYLFLQVLNAITAMRVGFNMFESRALLNIGVSTLFSIVVYALIIIQIIKTLPENQPIQNTPPIA